MNKSTFKIIQKKSLNLHASFQEISKKKWVVQDIVAELTIQIGHIMTASKISIGNLNESERKLDDLSDEVADVLLQAMILAYLFDSKLEDFDSTDNYDEYNSNLDVVLSFYQIASQLTESSMRLNGKRFPQKRDLSYDGELDFFLQRLNKLIFLLLCFSKENSIDIKNCFLTMEKDAYRFLSSYDEYFLTVQGIKKMTKKENNKIAKKLKEIQ